MKPEQFIKRYGVDEVKKVIAEAPEGTEFIGPYDSKTILVDYYKASDDSRLALWNENEWVCLSRVRKEFPYCFISISHLEGLVESVDLVKSYGGVQEAEWHISEQDDLPEYCYRLRAAIDDHESIYGEDHE